MPFRAANAGAAHVTGNAPRQGRVLRRRQEPGSQGVRVTAG